MKSKDVVRSVDFASPNNATIGPRFPSWQRAVDYAKGTIVRHEYPGQGYRETDPGFHPRRYDMEGGTLVIYSRAFVHMRVVVKYEGGGGQDGVAATWEVFRDGAVEVLS